MFAVFDKQLQEILKDNLSGSQSLTANIAQMFKGLIIKTGGSKSQVVNWLRKACFSISSQHPDLTAVVKMAKKLTTILESGLPLDYKLNSVLETLSRWDIVSSEELNQKIYLNIREYLQNYRVFVLHSQSATVLNVVKNLSKEKTDLKIVQTVSYPACEGELMARKLVQAGIEVELIADSGLATAVKDADAVLIGADSINRKFLINKQGTLGLSVAAKHFGKPVYALAGSEKIIKADIELAKLQNPGELSPFSHEKLHVNNTYFDFTPLELIKGITTENGYLRPEEIT